jgi:hypothetical protein
MSSGVGFFLRKVNTFTAVIRDFGRRGRGVLRRRFLDLIQKFTVQIRGLWRIFTWKWFGAGVFGGFSRENDPNPPFLKNFHV